MRGRGMRSTRALLALKIWRDALALGSTSLALVILMLVGTGLYVVFTESRLNLELSYRTFYDQHRFADATVLVDIAPESLVNTARLIPGVREAIGRAVKDGTIILRDRPRRRVTGRFIGTSALERPPVNDVHLVRGRYLSSRDDCLLEQQFASVHDLEIGDLITASYLGRRRDFRLVGVVASPEYLYPAPSKEASWASPQWFGVCWIDQDTARQWLGLGGSITELHVLCEPGTADRALEILKSLGERYGLRSWWNMTEQPSNNLLATDLQGFTALSIMFPAMFMFAAGLSLYSSLTRIGRLQTGVVGFLRASGFSSRQVLWHYVAQGGLLAFAGAAPGALIGHLFSVWTTTKYAGALHLPLVLTPPHFDAIATGVTLAVLTGLASAWLPARTAASTPPAIAMRGDRGDDTIHAGPWLMAVTRRLPILMRISFRGLVRRPSRTLFAVGGLVGGASLLLSTLGLYAAIMGTIDDYMYETLRYELDVSFISVEGESLADAVARVPGVHQVVKTCRATIRVRSPRDSVSVDLLAVEPNQQLMALRGADGRVPDTRPGEIWIPSKMAARLRVEPGDPVLVEWAYSSRSRHVKTIMRVGGLLDPTLGGMAMGDYQDMRRRLVERIYPDGGYGCMVRCTPQVGFALRRQLERSELVAAVASIGEARDEVEASLGVTIIFVSIMLGFGAVLSWAVLHSVASVGILERMRELATLRSLGFSARATTVAAAVEMYLMALMALLFGLPLGTWLNTQYLSLYETETTTFRSEMPLWAYLMVTLMVLGMVALSLQAGLNRLRTMDLAQATKARE